MVFARTEKVNGKIKSGLVLCGKNRKQVNKRKKQKIKIRV